MTQDTAIVDLSFPLRGATIPADHGYVLYGALSRRFPSLHGDKSVGIHPIRGRLVGNRRLQLNKSSRLELRLATERIGQLIPLVGQELDLDGCVCQVGIPSVKPLQAKASLSSRLVTIRGFTEPESFFEAMLRQLELIGIGGTARLLPQVTHRSFEGLSEGHSLGWTRRTLRIRDKEILGFAVSVLHLTPEESLLLQKCGLGGRRRFGCGLFVPTGG
ncbi:MAG: type I-MYXAN CRISPR-associated protein Cas6/Cmx6 [Chloroflexota bacterium]|nr:MAG: type I-MYXAN CRISPR-associated protein Cas6/Cmx6 [Chloroflexota bacterium]